MVLYFKGIFSEASQGIYIRDEHYILDKEE